MVRTRRQAASQADPATSQQSAESDSNSEVSDIPASGRRSKSDPARLGTLRPPVDGRPNVFLVTKKRRAAAPAQAASQSPSEAKKRRAELALFASSTNKRRKTLPADAVNPVAMAVFNQFNKKARSRTQAPQPRRITVEIPQGRSRGGVPAPEEGISSEEEHAHGDTAPSEPALEERSQDEPEIELEESLVTTHADAQNQAGTQGEQAPPSNLIGGRAPDVGESHVQSGQDAPQQASPQMSRRPTRKSKRRVPKRAFNEPLSVPAPVASTAEPTSAALESSEQVQEPPTTTGLMSTTQHIQELFATDQPSSTKQPASESMFVEDDDPDEDAVADLLEEPSGELDVRDSVSHAAPSAKQVQLTVQVPSKEVRTMCTLMGTKGWTGLGRSWASQLTGRDAPDVLRPTSKFGQWICKVIMLLRNTYGMAPQALAKQESFLREREKKTELGLEEITDRVDKTCENYYAAIESSGDGSGVTLPPVMKADILQCVIPMLVLLLRDFFLLGGSSEDRDGNRALPAKAGVFTGRTLQLLRRTAGRIRALSALIRRDTELGGLAPSSEEDDDGDEAKVKVGASEGSNTLREMIKKRIKQRIDLDDAIVQFLGKLSEARDKLEGGTKREARNKELQERAVEKKAERERLALAIRHESERRAAEEQAEKERRERLAHEQRLERQKRAEEELARRERAREEELAKRQRRYEAMCASTQRLRDEIAPASSLRAKARRPESSHTGRLPTAGQRDQVPRSRVRSPELGEGFEETRAVHVEHDVNPVALSPWSSEAGDAIKDRAVPRGPPWRDEEQNWLLGKLKEGGKLDFDDWAEALERAVSDVKQEAEALKISMRDLSAKFGKRVPAWARC